MNEAIFIHDWFLLLVTSILYPHSIFYTSIPLIYYRIHQDNTLGLNYNNQVRFTHKERIEGVEKTILFLKEIVTIVSAGGKNQYIEKTLDQIEFNNLRREYLNGRGNLFSLIKQFPKYLNINMFFGDIIYKLDRKSVV